MTDRKCRHGYSLPWRNQIDCSYDDRPDGATVADLQELDRFEISGRGTVILVDKIDNERGIVGRTVRIGGVEHRVEGYESCLIPGHDRGHCRCFAGTGLLVAATIEKQLPEDFDA
jgi:hypothetical protein